MKFHFCKEGETLLSIARDEGISPVRLLEENALSDPDRLVKGQCLAIYSASRTYTVRGGDTLQTLSVRIGKDEAELRRLNPGIGERGLLYPGQTLVLGRGAPPLGVASVIGMARPTVSLQTIRNFCSALTYLAIIPHIEDWRSGFHISKCEQKLAFAKEKGVLSLLALPLSAVTEDTARELTECGFAGVLVEGTGCQDRTAEAIKYMKSAGLSVVLRSDHLALSPCDADLVISGRIDGSESFYSHCRRLSETESVSPYKLMALLSAGSHVHPPLSGGASAPRMSNTAAFAYRRNAPILHDTEGRPYLVFTHTKHGKTEKKTLLFEDLASIRKGLTVIGESGISGIAMELEGMSPSVATLLCHCFDIIRPQGRTGVWHSPR